jgi:hypothetical protein
MKKQVVAFVKDLRNKPERFAGDEAATKQAVVLKLLDCLGWDIFNVEEVQPDWRADHGSAAYALRIESTLRVLLDVKCKRDNPEELHRGLVDLAIREGAELCALTDGLRWWFYLSSAKGAWTHKRCRMIDIPEQKAEQSAAELAALLARERVATGQYLEAAKEAFQDQKRRATAEVLPGAWNKVLAGPNNILVEILGEASEKLCGYKAEPGVVEEFIRKNLPRWLLPAEARGAPAAANPAPAVAGAAPPSGNDSADIKTRKPEFFADKSIHSFTFQGNTFPVRSWEEMLSQVCNHFAVTHSREFEKVLWLYEDQSPCFSRYSDQLRIPEKIRKTNIYVETKLSAEEIVKTVGDLLTEFGYGHEDLVITTQ